MFAKERAFIGWRRYRTNEYTAKYGYVRYYNWNNGSSKSDSWTTVDPAVSGWTTVDAASIQWTV